MRATDLVECRELKAEKFNSDRVWSQVCKVAKELFNFDRARSQTCREVMVRARRAAKKAK